MLKSGICWTINRCRQTVPSPASYHIWNKIQNCIIDMYLKYWRSVSLPISTSFFLSQSLYNRTLRSNQGTLLVDPRVMTVAGSRAFGSCAPRLWNSLPFSLCMQVSVQGFKQRLKPIYLVLPILHKFLVIRLRSFVSTGIVTGLLPLWIMLDGMVSALELWLCWGDWHYRSNIIIIVCGHYAADSYGHYAEVSISAKHLTWCVQSRCTDRIQQSSAMSYYFGGATSQISGQKLNRTSHGRPTTFFYTKSPVTWLSDRGSSCSKSCWPAYTSIQCTCTVSIPSSFISVISCVHCSAMVLTFTSYCYSTLITSHVIDTYKLNPCQLTLVAGHHKANSCFSGISLTYW